VIQKSQQNISAPLKPNIYDVTNGEKNRIIFPTVLFASDNSFTLSVTSLLTDTHYRQEPRHLEYIAANSRKLKQCRRGNEDIRASNVTGRVINIITFFFSYLYMET
jgi:hypothetical protein